MKKLLCMLLPLVILFGCSKNDKAQRNISVYFPFYQNRMYVYTGSGSKFANQKVYTMYVNENKMQRRIDMGTMIMTEIFQNINGELKYSNVAVDAFHLENMLDTNLTDSFVELKEPLEVGNSWSFSDTSDYKKEITDMAAKIETPYATFDNAMEITAKFSDNTITKQYYVPDVGFIKSISYTDDGPIIIQLSQIIDDSLIEMDKTIYIVDENAEKLFAKPFTIQLKTNDDVTQKILVEMKKNNLVEQDAKINKFEIERSDLQNQIMKVDFNNGFVDLTKFGAQSEFLTLQAIVNTLGNSYGVDKVRLTVDGKNYESGHISMGDEEYFDVE